MKLSDALDQLLECDDDQVLFARKPWSFECDALITQLDSNLGVPGELTNLGYAYFLESFVAREVVEAFGDFIPTPESRRSLLMYYAEFDAYPEWFFAMRDGSV